MFTFLSNFVTARRNRIGIYFFHSDENDLCFVLKKPACFGKISKLASLSSDQVREEKLPLFK